MSQFKPGDYVKIIKESGFKNRIAEVVSVDLELPGRDWFWVVVSLDEVDFIFSSQDLEKVKLKVV